MSKSIVNELAATIAGSKLPVFNGFSLKLSSKTTPIRIITSTSGSSDFAKAKIRGNGYFTDSGDTTNLGKDITFSNAGSLYVKSSSDLELIITDKRDIKTLNISQANANVIGTYQASLFKQMTTLETLIIPATTIGDLFDFQALVNLTSLYINSAPIGGLLKSLGTMTNLTTIDVTYTANINGSVEDFVAQQVANGRNSEPTGINLDTIGHSGNITFEGTKLSDRGVLTWTSGGAVITYTPD